MEAPLGHIRLSPEVWKEILSHLPMWWRAMCCRVCKVWQKDLEEPQQGQGDDTLVDYGVATLCSVLAEGGVDEVMRRILRDYHPPGWLWVLRGNPAHLQRGAGAWEAFSGKGSALGDPKGRWCNRAASFALGHCARVTMRVERGLTAHPCVEGQVHAAGPEEGERRLYLGVARVKEGPRPVAGPWDGPAVAGGGGGAQAAAPPRRAAEALRGLPPPAGPCGGEEGLRARGPALWCAQPPWEPVGRRLCGLGACAGDGEASGGRARRNSPVCVQGGRVRPVSAGREEEEERE